MLEDLPALWGKAKSGKLEDSSGPVDGVYVGSVEEKAITALKPRPAFRAMFQITTTKEGSE
jgi:hypothetical protein